MFHRGTGLREIMFRSHGSNNDHLVDALKRHRVIQHPDVEEAMRAVDRGFYCPHNPYFAAPESIGYRATISAPHMHAYALEVLREKLKPGAKVLDVGSGSGYLTVCFAKMVHPGGRVVGIDHIPELVEQSVRNIRRNAPYYLDNGTIKLVAGDGRKGYAPEAPFDAIHVGAAAEEGVPRTLIEQLAPGGKMVIPVGDPSRQELEEIDKLPDGRVSKRGLMGVRFVPLTEKEYQYEMGY